MKCKARMIDGSPVTFEIARQTPQHSHVGMTTFVGEGFFVMTELYDNQHSRHRHDMEERALRENGVVTATVQYWIEGKRWPRFTDGSSDTFWQDAHWHPLFPPPKQTEYAAELAVNDKIFWTTAEVEVVRLNKMLDAERNMNKVLMARLEALHAPAGFRYVDAEGVTQAMLDAGAAAMKESIVTNGCLIRGELWFSPILEAVERIWRAMEKARTR